MKDAKNTKLMELIKDNENQISMLQEPSRAYML